MDIREIKELIKQYPICLIHKENGESKQFNVFALMEEIERLNRIVTFLKNEHIELLKSKTQLWEICRKVEQILKEGK